MKIIDRIALILLIIGGLNWGLVGIFDFDLVSYIASTSELIKNIIYIIVGLSAVWCISLLFRNENEIIDD